MHTAPPLVALAALTALVAAVLAAAVARSCHSRSRCRRRAACILDGAALCVTLRSSAILTILRGEPVQRTVELCGTRGVRGRLGLRRKAARRELEATVAQRLPALPPLPALRAEAGDDGTRWAEAGRVAEVVCDDHLGVRKDSALSVCGWQRL